MAIVLVVTFVLIALSIDNLRIAIMFWRREREWRRVGRAIRENREMKTFSPKPPRRTS